MAKVYLIQEPYEDRDLSSAQRYGAIIPVLSQKDRPSLLPGPCFFKVRKVLAEMSPDDYIVWAGGDFSAGLIVGAVLRDLNFQSFKLLRWERERATTGERTGAGFYIPVEVPLK